MRLLFFLYFFTHSMNSGILSGTFSLIGLRFKLMQAGTEFAMESCSRLGFARGRAVSLRDPVDQGQGLAGRGHAFAGGTLGGRLLILSGAGPVLLWGGGGGGGEGGKK